jgi:hypothetical protein
MRKIFFCLFLVSLVSAGVFSRQASAQGRKDQAPADVECMAGLDAEQYKYGLCLKGCLKDGQPRTPDATIRVEACNSHCDRAYNICAKIWADKEKKNPTVGCHHIADACTSACAKDKKCEQSCKSGHTHDRSEICKRLKV